MAAITAKVRCGSRVRVTEELDVVHFGPDYTEGANAEWAYYTPSLSLQMNVRRDVPFEQGVAYTVTFTKDE
jgi:hypothetical protein